jgi:N-formylglutamate deformylase
MPARRRRRRRTQSHERDHYTLHRGTTPLLISLPHVGTRIPDSLKPRLVERALAVEDTDWHLDRLYAFARDLGASVIVPRSLALRDRPEPPAGEQRRCTRRQQHRAVPDALLHRRAAVPRRARAARRRTSSPSGWPATGARTTTRWRPNWRGCERARPRGAVGRAQHPLELPWLFEGKLPDLNLGTARRRRAAHRRCAKR